VIYEEREPFTLKKESEERVTVHSAIVQSARSNLAKLILNNLIQPKVQVNDSLLELLLKARQVPVTVPITKQEQPETGFAGNVQKTTFAEGFKVKSCAVGLKAMAIGAQDGIIEIWDRNQMKLDNNL
jgi:hypothetical protein